MTDNLRGAVAEVVMHFLSDAEIASLTKEQSVALSDAVIAELGLEREHWQYGDGDTMGVRYRYVTHWEESNEYGI